MALVLRESFKKSLGEFTNKVMLFMFASALIYSISMFLGDTIGIVLPDGSKGFEAGFMVMCIVIVIILTMYIVYTKIKSFIDFMFVDTYEEARKYLLDYSNRLTKELVLLNLDTYYEDKVYLHSLLKSNKKIMEDEYNVIGRFNERKYLLIVLHSYCLIYIKVVKEDTEPIIVDNLEEYLKTL